MFAPMPPEKLFPAKIEQLKIRQSHKCGGHNIADNICAEVNGFNLR